MIVTPIKTHKITSQDTDIYSILDNYVQNIKENSVLVITSKILAITQGRVVAVNDVNKDELIEKESHYYLPRDENPYQVSLTITNDTLVATAGIDESNANGCYILWPENLQKNINDIRKHIQEKLDLKNLGIIVTDSKTSPLRWGVTAIALAYSGINPTKNYIGKPDLFGRPFAFEQMSIIDNLACAAAVVMGEGAEQTPIAIIEDIPFVEFRKNDPSEEELGSLRISMEEDLYTPLLRSVEWRKGKK